MAGLQCGGTCHVYLSLVGERLCTFPGQPDRVRFFLAGSGVFVYLVQKKIFNCLRCQCGWTVGTIETEIHSLELKLQLR